MRDPLQHLPRLRRLRQELAGLPAGAVPDAALAQALAEAVRATAPPPPLPWRQRGAMLAFALIVGAAGYAWKGTPAGWNPAPAPDPAAQMVQRLAQRHGVHLVSAYSLAWDGKGFIQASRRDITSA